MKIESHLENLKESIRHIERAITEGIEANQRTIGFHASSEAVDMLEILLHSNNLIDMGFTIKHETFHSKNKVLDKLNFYFPRKQEIIDLMMKIEELRNIFCYGKRRTENEIIPVIESFNKLKTIFVEVSGYEL